MIAMSLIHIQSFKLPPFFLLFPLQLLFSPVRIKNYGCLITYRAYILFMWSCTHPHTFVYNPYIHCMYVCLGGQKLGSIIFRKICRGDGSNSPSQSFSLISLYSYPLDPAAFPPSWVAGPKIMYLPLFSPSAWGTAAKWGRLAAGPSRQPSPWTCTSGNQVLLHALGWGSSGLVGMWLCCLGEMEEGPSIRERFVLHSLPQE